MPSSPRPDGQYCPEQEEVNARFRRLMEQPPTRERTEAWQRLLLQWADVCQECARCSFTTAA